MSRNTLLTGLVAALCVGALWIELEPVHWVFALATHWRLPFGGLCLGVGALALGLGRRRVAGLALALALLSGAVMWPELSGDASAPRASPERAGAASGPSVYLLNVRMNRGNHDRVGQAIREAQADVVLLVEVDRAWLDGLEPHLVGWPHRVQAPRDDFLGLAIYSRLPLGGEAHTLPGGQDGPMLSVRVGHGDSPLWVGLVHALPPIRGDWVENQRLIFEHLETRPWGTGPALVCGDLNATPWSRGLRRLRERSGLAHARPSGWPAGTWPAGSPWGIPIDHCLLSPGLEVVSYAVGPSVGSDHRPLRITLHRP